MPWGYGCWLWPGMPWGYGFGFWLRMPWGYQMGRSQVCEFFFGIEFGEDAREHAIGVEMPDHHAFTMR